MNYKITYNSPNFNYYHSYDEDHFNIDTHIHDCYEIFYLIKGNITYHIEGQSYKLKENDIVFTNTRELHRIVREKNTIYERKFIHFSTEFISAFQNNNYNLLKFLENRRLGHLNVISQTVVQSKELEKIWTQIEEYCVNEVPESEIMIKTLLIQLLIQLNNSFISNNNCDDLIFFDKKIYSILEYINCNLHEKITLDLLSKLFYVNKYYLSHSFKQSTGFGVIEYLNYKRIMKSQELLCSGTPILDVSLAVGFPDYSNFYKTFRKIIGISPRDYIKTL